MAFCSSHLLAGHGAATVVDVALCIVDVVHGVRLVACSGKAKKGVVMMA